MRTLLFRAVLAVAVLASGALYVSMDKTVLVDIDGEIRSVRTFATDVGSALERAGIDIGEHDAVVPDVEVGVHDRSQIVVRRGRQLDLVVNGVRKQVWVTALSVADALEQLNVRADSRAFVSASRSRPIPLTGFAMEVRLPARVRVLVDGTSKVVTTTAATVEELLAEAKVTLAPTDQTSMAKTAYPADNTTLRVTRVRGRTLVETTLVPKEVQRIADPTLLRGAERIVESGIDGLIVARFAVTYVDGKVATRKLISRKMTRKPKTRVVKYGTKDPRTQSCKSTWYYRDGMVAAHRKLPKGTVVRVVSVASGKSVTVTIDDRGPYGGPDFCIDLSDDAFKQLAPLGQGVMAVRLYW